MCRTPRIAELPNFPLGNILKDIAAHNRDTGLVREPRVLQNRFSVPSHKGFLLCQRVVPPSERFFTPVSCSLFKQELLKVGSGARGRAVPWDRITQTR